MVKTEQVKGYEKDDNYWKNRSPLRFEKPNFLFKTERGRVSATWVPAQGGYHLLTIDRVDFEGDNNGTQFYGISRDEVKKRLIADLKENFVNVEEI